MDNRNKRYVLLFVFIGIVVHLLFIGCSSDRSTDKAHANNEQNDETGKAEQSVSTEETDEVELNPFGNTVQKEDITEAHILQYIHYPEFRMWITSAISSITHMETNSKSGN